MASVVCQGLQACIKPPLIETTILTHNSSSKPTQENQKPILEVNSNNGESFSKKKGWTTFLSVLEKPSLNYIKSEEVYVHPMVKRSASALSSVSLEMCTESLGTETGSDVSESSDEFTLEEREKYRSLMRSKARAFDRKMVSQRKGGGGLPPPLTSISGSDGTVKVKPHREGGRLVIKAVSVSDCGTKFEAERTNGRLKLSLSKDCFVKVETRGAREKNMGIEKDCCDSDVLEGGRGEMNENRWKVGGKTGLKIRSLKRPSRLPNSFDDSNEFVATRCKDGRNGTKGIGNWSLFRVVIS
ncbi:FANTASTIC FOUR 1-like protein [Tanacetum coccineum]